MPYQRLATVFLSQWTEVQRQLAEVEPGTPLAESLQAEADKLQAEYRRLIREARAAHEPEPQPFPVEA